MARLARAEVFDPSEVSVAHVISRTVRRCFLFGDDPISGKNFDHRKVWIEQYLQQFAAQFGIDLLGFSILSSHFHLILRSRPDVVATWDDTQVARRWLMICPHRRDSNGQAMAPSEPELDTIRNCPIRLAEIRCRLSNISWWMRLLSQRVAQRANQEDEQTGRFFQDRYRAVRLIDEAALLACAVYVDLNPIRASISLTLEQSEHTSVQRRIESLDQTPSANSNSQEPASPTGESLRPIAAACPVGDASSQRHDVAIEEDQDLVDTGDNAREGNEAGRKDKPFHVIPLVRDDRFLSPVLIDEANEAAGPAPSETPYRCSDKGFLWFSTERYLELLDWTARQSANGKVGKTPGDLSPILQRLGIKSSVWCDLVAEFGTLFHNVAGHPARVDAERSRQTHRRFHLSRRVRELMPIG